MVVQTVHVKRTLVNTSVFLMGTQGWRLRDWPRQGRWLQSVYPSFSRNLGERREGPCGALRYLWNSGRSSKRRGRAEESQTRRSAGNALPLTCPEQLHTVQGTQHHADLLWAQEHRYARHLRQVKCTYRLVCIKTL